MKRKQTPEPRLSKMVIFGLLFSMTVYFTLSIISVYELKNLCLVLATEPLKIKLEIVFIAAVITRIYLTFIKSIAMHWLKVTLELAPAVIIIIFFLFSEPIVLSRSCEINLFAILICEIMSSFMLYVFEKLLPERYKWSIS